MNDLRYALRMMARNPGFTMVALLTLALGIGANTAIFSVVNAVLLRPLPFPESERLAMVWLDNRRIGIREDITSYPNFIDWRDQNRTFEGMAAMRPLNLNLTGQGEPEEIRGAMVTANFFGLMRVNPARGRGFTPEEEQPGRDNIAVLSHGLWQRRFGGDPAILNQKINLNGQPITVVGIMPPGFDFPARVELWSPLAPNERQRAARGNFWLPVVGRIKPGVTRAEAQSDLDLIARRLEEQYPNINLGYGVNIVPLLEQTVGAVRPALLVLFGAVGLVLLVACANVANLLLARASAREKEIALRAALGAGRGRIIRQLLTESVLLAGAGGLLGLLIARVGLDLLIRLNPAEFPRIDQVDLDTTALGFTLVLTFATGIIFGLAPALASARLDLNEALKEGGRTGSGGGRSASLIRNLFVVAEVALALVLLAGAGLLLRSFWQLQQVDPGFNPHGLLTLQLRLPRTKYPEGPQVAAFYERLRERLAALPGVEGVGATSSILLGKIASSSSFTIENRPPEPEAQRQEVPIDTVTPDYFKTIGIPLRHGRYFDARDGRGTLAVGIINETMAEKYWPGEDPIGRRFTYGTPQPGVETQWITVVGVVGDTRRQGLDAPIRIESFLPHAQQSARGMEMVIRVAGDPLALAPAAREAVRALDPDLPVARIRTVDLALRETFAQRRVNMLLLGLFAALALLLAAVGIYGVMSYSVAQRTHELGIRLALGARSSDLTRLVVTQGLKLASLGLGLGLLGALAVTRLLSGLLYGVTASDPLTYLAIAGLLLVVALLACWVPARRAARTDPMIALRSE